MIGERGAERAPFYLGKSRELLAVLTLDIAVLTTGAAVVITGVATDEHLPETHHAVLVDQISPELGMPETTTIKIHTSSEQTVSSVTTALSESTTTELTTTTTSPSSTTTLPPTTTTTQPAPPKQELQSTPVVPVRSHEQRCQEAIAKANVTPAPGYFITCGPEYLYNSGEDGDTCAYYYRDMPEAMNENSGQPRPKCLEPNSGVAGQSRIHPDDSESDAVWIETVKHEVGHGYCYYEYQDPSEACANAWARTH